MRRREFFKTVGCSVAGNALALGGTVARKPNIVFVSAESLGVGGVSCYGADNFRTPNIDALARGGTRFTHAYTAPLSGPSRAVMLTGRYAFRTGVTSQGAPGRLLPSRETTMPKILKAAGYVTASVGKWIFPPGPAEFGYDEYLQVTDGGGYWNLRSNSNAYTVNGRIRVTRGKQYMPDVMHDFLVEFIGRHRHEPFHAYYAMSQMRADFQPTPDSAPDSRDYYTDNINYMDKLVGKLVGELERLKLRENTLILFVGDSGTGSVYAGESTVRGQRLSGEKGSMLEGGALVPLIVNWPGTTPAGEVNSDLIDSSDLLPTLTEVASAQPPQGVVIDGRSFAPRLRGGTARPRDWIYVQLGTQWYVRDSAWKLNQAGLLFDMSQAPFEEFPVPAEATNPEAVAARQRLRAVLDELNPAGGILDDGDGTGRRANRTIHVKKRRK